MNVSSSEEEQFNDEELREQRIATISERFENAFNDIRHSVTDEDRSKRNDVWNSLWKDNVTPWDLGKPTPALVNELEQYYLNLPNQPTNSNNDTATYTVRILVPGCGSGYDLVTLAYHIDKLIQQQQQQQSSDNSTPQRYKAIVVGFELSNLQLDRSKYVLDRLLQSKTEVDGPLVHTKIYLVKGDFFVTDGEEIMYTLGANSVDTTTVNDKDKDVVVPKQYDLIFDYTFFCAIPPVLRSKWGDRMAQLLTDNGGRLITFMFPLVQSIPADYEQLQGPPFPVTVDEYKLVLEKHHITIDTGNANPHRNSFSIPSRAERELICWWTKK